MWEDDACKNGGRWDIWVQKGYSNRLWEDLLLALIGNQFERGDQICGIEVRTKHKGDTISVWNKNADDVEEKESIRLDLLKAINAPEGLSADYQAFNKEESHKPKYSHKRGGR